MYTEYCDRIAGGGSRHHHEAPKIGDALTGKELLGNGFPRPASPMEPLLPFTTRAEDCFPKSPQGRKLILILKKKVL